MLKIRTKKVIPGYVYKLYKFWIKSRPIYLVTLLQRGSYKYWQAFGSDGMAGLYDFVKRAPGQREIRSTYGSFGAPNAQPSYDQYSSSWYRQPDVQRYSQPRTSYSRGYYNRAPYSNGYYESTAPSSNSYSAPRQSNKKKTYQYWQGFGSDGLAGLYDFVRKWANQPFWWQQSSVPSLLPSVFKVKHIYVRIEFQFLSPCCFWVKHIYWDQMQTSLFVPPLFRCLHSEVTNSWKHMMHIVSSLF